MWWSRSSEASQNASRRAPAVGIAAWAAIFLGRGSEKVPTSPPATRTADGERLRELIEATSSGNLDQALAAVPPQAQKTVTRAAQEGFLAGMNDALTLGAANWLVEITNRKVSRASPFPSRSCLGHGSIGWCGMSTRAAMVIGAAIGLALGILVSVTTDIPLAPEGGLVLGLLAGWLSHREAA